MYKRYRQSCEFFINSIKPFAKSFDCIYSHTYYKNQIDYIQK